MPSLWLRCSGNEQERFQAAIDLIAARFGTPYFQAHMTLIGSADREQAVLAATCMALAEKSGPLALRATGIEETEQPFMSLFVAFELDEALLGLYRKAHEQLNIELPSSFRPHVSLGYYVESSAAKSDIMDGLKEQFVGKTFLFDHLTLSSSGIGVPIADWRDVQVYSLSA